MNPVSRRSSNCFLRRRIAAATRASLHEQAEEEEEEEGFISLRDRRSPTFSKQQQPPVSETQFTAALGSAAGREAYAALLRQCEDSKSVSRGQRVHAAIAAAGLLGRDAYLCNMLVQMYGKCGSLELARSVFETMVKRSVYSWTIMITASTQNGDYLGAIHLLRRMELEGAKANHVTLLNVVSACSWLKCPDLASDVHARVVVAGYESNIYVAAAIVNLYGKCGCVAAAREVFDRMKQRNVVAWNSIISAYAQWGQGWEAISLYRDMLEEGVVFPDVITVVSCIDACASVQALDEGREIHMKAVVGSRLETDIVVGTALVNMYGKCCSFEEAKLVFDGMPKRNVVTWNALIAAYAQGGCFKDALTTYQTMVSQHTRLKPTEFTFNAVLGACASLTCVDEGRKIHSDLVSLGLQQHLPLGAALVNMYGKCGSVCEARKVFDGLAKKDVFCWTAMIATYSQQGHPSEAIKMYHRMDPEGVKPDAVTFTTVIDACSALGSIGTGRLVHARAVASGFGSDEVVANAAINMYSKCGSLGDAKCVFQSMPKKNVGTWSTMIGALVDHGQCDEAFDLYKKMDLKPNDITFLLVLGACSSPEALAKGKVIHDDIRLSPYVGQLALENALLNMYGKCGSRTDATELFESMSSRNVISWNTMIACLAQHGRFEEALQVYRRMDVMPTQATFSSALTACAGAGDIQEGRTMHSRMQDMSYDQAELLGNKLITMYGKCGTLEEAENVFCKLPSRDTVTWSAMIGAYCQQGLACRALDMLKEMEVEGIEPDEVTFISILFACSHAGMNGEARDCFKLMVADHEIEAIGDHFACLVDLFGRSGRTEGAQELVTNMPGEPTQVAWTTLLSACQSPEEACRIAEKLAAKGSSYVLLSNLYMPTDS